MILKTVEIAELCVKVGFCKSLSEARRMIKQGAIRVNDEKINDEFAQIGFLPGTTKYAVLEYMDR